jgi:hypothetical protein
LLINKIPVFTWRGEAAPGENWDFTGILFYGKPLSNWSFDYFFCNAAKRSRRERFAASLFLAPIFPETLTESAFQEKSALLSQKSST